MSRKPDYEIKVGRRVEQGEKSYSTKVGVGFTNRAGGINVLLDPGIALVGGKDVQITLWPWRERDDRGARERTQAPPQDDFSDDNLPF